MKLRIHLLSGEILDFSDRPEGTQEIDDKFKFSIVNKRLFVLACTNGDFLINVDQIMYMQTISEYPEDQ